jgi:hypothetical protein
MEGRMMIDRTTKLILAAIALGLWANFAAQMLRSAAADQIDTLVLNAIAGDTSRALRSLIAVETGRCVNSKIC